MGSLTGLLFGRRALSLLQAAVGVLHIHNIMIAYNVPVYTATCPCLQCFDAVGWAAGRASGL